MIPTKEQVIKMEWAGAWFHFNQRLNERYGIDVTLDEYMVIRRQPITVTLKNKHKIIGWMTIKNNMVLVVREKHRKKKLLTALPKTHKYWTNTNNTTKNGRTSG